MKRVARSRLRVVVAVAAACGLAPLSITACPADGPAGEGEGEGESEVRPEDEEARQRLLTNWQDTLLMPMHEAFVTTSTTLAAASTAFCADVTDVAAFAAVQDAWKATHAAYKRIEVLRFGPIVAYPERYGPTVDFWPVREARIDDVLDGDAEITAAFIGAQGAVARGLPVVEVLLWPFGENGAGLDLYVDTETGARRCSYLQVASVDIQGLATGLRDAWSVDGGAFVRQLTQPTTAGAPTRADWPQFSTTQVAFSELVNRMGFTIENIRRDRLGRLSAETVECAYSGRSVEAMRDNLVTVLRLFYGGDATSTTTPAEATATSTSLGLVDHPRLVERPDIIAAFATAQRNAFSALAAVEEPFGIAVVEDRDGIAAADAALHALQIVVQADIINVLGLTLAFNDNDGD